MQVGPCAARDLTHAFAPVLRRDGLAEVVDSLRAARWSGVETVQRCAEAVRVLDFFETSRPPG